MVSVLGRCSALHILGCVVALAVSACTEPAQREQLRVEIEADSAVRALVDEVSAEIEYANPNGGWQPILPMRFEPKVRNPFPIAFSVPAIGRRVSYQLRAIARDERGAIVARARALRDWDATGPLLLRVIFEQECIRRTPECSNGQTCHDGECVDARLDTSEILPVDEVVEDAGPADNAGPDPGGPVTAGEDEPCAPDGARACTGELSRTPLYCEDGVWKPSPMCAESELCDTTRGSQRGTCRAIAPECRGQLANRAFCDDNDLMRVCTSMFQSVIRECDENEQCSAPQSEAMCQCRLGFVDSKDGDGCRASSSCDEMNGGCDLLSKCTMVGGTPKCGDCPPEYTGTGESGCELLLSGLSVSAGQLIPAFKPDVHAYRLRVPLLAQRVVFTPIASSEARIELNGAATPAGQAWATPTLPLKEFPVKLALTSSSGASSTYEVVIEREGSQQAYLKASNAEAGDMFGPMIAMSGDTLVVGAPEEDSNSKAIDGDQNNNSLEASGAVYVFTNRGDSWVQQAYLKPSDALADDYFGLSVAISGDTLVIGAVHAPIFRPGANTATRPGVAYVFTRTQGKWGQVSRLSPTTGSNGDWFGYNVAAEGDMIAIGAPRDAGSGAAYIYERIGGEWREQKKVKASPVVMNAMFGTSLAVSNTTLVVGSADDGSDMNDAGSAHVFTRGAGEWAQTQRLVGNPIAAGANFGYAMAMKGDHLLIGAPRALSIGTWASTAPGEVFAYRRNGTSWEFKERLRALLPRTSDSFGSAVAMTADAAAIGSCGDASGASGIGGDASRRDAGYAGAGYLFALEGDKWKLSAYIKAQEPDGYDSLGFGAAISEDAAAFSAIWEESAARGVNGDQSNNSAPRSGAAYVFQ